MPGEAFYAVSDLPPPWSVKTRVLWEGKNGLHGPFLAIRYPDKKSRAERWCTFENGEMIPLPVPDKRPPIPSQRWVGWHNLEGARPLYWAPQHPDLWKVPLPPVAFTWIDPDTVPNRMGSERQDFSAAELAEEMEADRETSRVQGEVRESYGNRLAWQWWRDSGAIKYETAENLTLRMAEGRLFRAVALSGAGEMEKQTSSVVGRALADAAAEVAHYVTSDAPVRLQPMPQDGGEEFLEAMRWFTSLGDRAAKAWALSRPQKVILWRALPFPLSFYEIAEHLKVSRQRAQEVHDGAIEKAWRVGAGLITTAAMIEIERLRNRNRSYRRTLTAEAS